jgi:hypothetical protein
MPWDELLKLFCPGIKENTMTSETNRSIAENRVLWCEKFITKVLVKTKCKGNTFMHEKDAAQGQKEHENTLQEGGQNL